MGDARIIASGQQRGAAHPNKVKEYVLRFWHAPAQRFATCKKISRKKRSFLVFESGFFFVGSVASSGSSGKMPKLYDGWFSTSREYKSSDGETIRKVS